MTTSDRARRALPTITIALAAMVMVCPPAGATDADMDLLPVVEPERCAICHVSPDPVPGSFALNAFGEDFLEAGRIWDAALAGLDSDGDGCLNGVELGDTDADGQADGNVSILQSNPGVEGDCGANSADLTTWTELKGLFSQK